MESLESPHASFSRLTTISRQSYDLPCTAQTEADGSEPRRRIKRVSALARGRWGNISRQLQQCLVRPALPTSQTTRRPSLLRSAHPKVTIVDNEKHCESRCCTCLLLASEGTMRCPAHQRSDLQLDIMDTSFDWLCGVGDELPARKRIIH